MTVTDENRNLIKLFIKLLMKLEMSDEAIGMTVAMLKSEDQLLELTDFVDNNPQATEAQILEEAERISGI